MQQYEDARQITAIAANANNHNIISAENRKRKRSSIAEGASFFEASILSHKPERNVTFSPITTVLRAHIPLAWLDNGSKPEEGISGACFEANIPTVTRWDYHLLVARQVPNGGLYLVERIEGDKFVCQGLRHWVKTEWIFQAAIGATPPVDVELMLRPSTSTVHQRKQSTSSLSSLQTFTTAPHQPREAMNRRGILARRSILEREPSVLTNDGQSGLDQANETQISQVEQQAHRDTPEVAALSDVFVGPKDDFTQAQYAETPAPTEAEQTMCKADLASDANVDQLSPEYLRKRYLEMLYLSKTSLAFYAKGPLSRTRARARVLGSSMNLNQLVEFYRGSVLSSKKLDLKYKESIQAKVLALPVSQSPEGNDSVMPTGTKPKKTRKTKLGKDGLWPMEHEYIEKWWQQRDHKATPIVSSAAVSAELKMALSHLRMRETELQIIIALEIFAIEARETASGLSSVTATDLNVKVETIENEDNVLAEAAKQKKRRDLENHLDDLIDKLCIWHSIGFDDSSPHLGTDHAAAHAPSSIAKDRLRDFCKDVVVPFYGGKLPGQCKSICKKLGGSELSPSQPRTARMKDTNHVLAGKVVKQPAQKRTLGRILDEDQSIRNPSPSILVRSATISVPPTAKRDSSERPMSRGGILKSASFTSREVDLVADANATAAKRRKMEGIAVQKRELAAAIATLKKPNRSLVAKDIMDEADRRSKDKQDSTKRTAPIQISATPRRSGTRVQHQVDEDDYDLPPLLQGGAVAENIAIPSSTIKPRGLGFVPHANRSSSQKRAVLSAIRDTPSKGSSHNSREIQHETETSFMNRATCSHDSSSTLVESTPAKTRTQPLIGDSMTCQTMDGIVARNAKTALFTAYKSLNSCIENVFKDIPEIPEEAGKAMDRVMQIGGGTTLPEPSIYDTLVWNDEWD